MPNPDLLTTEYLTALYQRTVAAGGRVRRQPWGPYQSVDCGITADGLVLWTSRGVVASDADGFARFVQHAWSPTGVLGEMGLLPHQAVLDAVFGRPANA